MQVEFKGLALAHEFMSIKDVQNGCAPTFNHGDKNNLANHGFSVIGTATLVVELHDPKTVQAGKIAALQEQLQAVRADNHRKANAILDAISKLQAIDYDPSAPTAEQFPDVPF